MLLEKVDLKEMRKVACIDKIKVCNSCLNEKIYKFVRDFVVDNEIDFGR